MESFVMSLIAVPITTFFTFNIFTLSYGDSCFWSFWGLSYFLLILPCVTWHRNLWYIFAFTVLIWHFCDKSFVVDYVFCDVVCILFSSLFLLVATHFFVFFHIEIIEFIFIVFVLVVLWSSYLILFWQYFMTCPVLSQLWHFGIFKPSLFQKSFDYFPYMLQVDQLPLYWDFA